MDSSDYAETFQTSGEAYFSFMGRYSEPLAELFVDSVGLHTGHSALDVGCGPGALTNVLVDRLGTGSVSACDPSPPFVTECASRCVGVDVREGRAEAIPFGDETFDAALAQLVLHFVSDPALAAGELRRVVRPGGVVGTCVWDSEEGMEMLRHFWAAALVVDPSAPADAHILRFGRKGEVAGLLVAAGLVDVSETTLRVRSGYRSFEELWAGFMTGIGPAASFCVSLPSRSVGLCGQSCSPAWVHPPGNSRSKRWPAARAVGSPPETGSSGSTLEVPVLTIPGGGDRWCVRRATDVREQFIHLVVGPTGRRGGTAPVHPRPPKRRDPQPVERSSGRSPERCRIPG